MRKVVLYLGMSLDGYIADKNGGVGWMEEDDTGSLEESSYPDFVQTVDTVLMGYTTYHQIRRSFRRITGHMRECRHMYSHIAVSRMRRKYIYR